MTNGIGRVGWRNFVSATPTASIITTGLVLNLDAGNAASYPGTGTTWTDLSGNGNNATLVNGTSYSSANGGTMVFDGVNDYALGAMNNFNNSTSFTQTVWMNSDTIKNDQFLISLIGGPPSQLYVGFASNGLGGVGTRNYGNFETDSSLSLNVWYMVTCTRSSTGIGKIYVNNQLKATGNFNALGTVTQYNIGRYGGGNYHFGGKIGASHVYNRDLTLSEIQQNFDATKSRFGYPSYTTRTTAFATATGITDTTILNALSTFDTGLISNGLDTKMKALYPFVGGTANTHKFNFMDARDVNAAFRLVFSGGWVHSSTGALPNGTNAYANTYLDTSTNLPTNTIHTSYYSRTNIALTSNQIFFDAFNSQDSCYQFFMESNSSTINHDAYNTDSLFGGRVRPSFTNTNGYYIGNRLSATKNSIHRNGSILLSNTTSGGTAPGLVLYMAAANTPGNTAVVFSKLEAAFSSIGLGLTDAEASTFYALVQAFQTSLSRAV